MPEESEFRSGRAYAYGNFNGALVATVLALQAVVVRESEHHARAKRVPIDAAHRRDR